ncbi:MAG: diguanylate cyclase [Syntrophales bacterium]
MKNEIIIKKIHSSAKSSIRGEIFQTSALIALIVVVFFGFLLSTVLYYSEISKARAVIERTNRALNLFVEGQFTEIINTIEVLEENKEIREAMTLTKEAQQRILDGYRSIAKVNKNITYIYSGYENGLMLINDYTPPPGYDPATRPWYRAAMATRPETSIGLPYQDIKTKEWLISTSRALKQSAGGYGGVVAVDCSIDQIADLIAQHGEYKTEFSFVMDRSGKIIMHPDQSLLNKSPRELTESLQHYSNGNFTYRNDNDVECIAHFSRIVSTGWTVVTMVEKRDVLHPVISKVLFIIGLTGFIALFLGFLQSIALSRRLSRPLVELASKIKAVIAGKALSVDEYVYPDNEIGIMAREVGKLAEEELNAKILELQAKEEKYRSVMELMFDPYTEVDLSGNFIFVNESMCRNLGYAREELIGKSFNLIVPADEQKAMFTAYNTVFQSGEPNKGYTHRSLKKDGSIIFAEVSIDLRRNGRGEVIGFRTISRDITERKRMEAEILASAVTDQLTGLHNRRGFLSLAGQQLKLAERNKCGLLLFFADLDGLKLINDKLGHEQGDNALIEAATVFKETFRTSDILARLGGDEYAVLAVDLTEENSQIFTARLQSLIDARNNLENRRYRLSISLGYSFYNPESPCILEELMASADKLMYERKQNKKSVDSHTDKVPVRVSRGSTDQIIPQTESQVNGDGGRSPEDRLPQDGPWKGPPAGQRGQ